MHQDLFKYVAANIAQRKLRSWLTILGIVIGITAIVTLMSVAQGLNESIRQELEMFGSDMIIVMPASSGGFGGPMMAASSGTLTINDVQDVRKTPGMDPDTVTAMVFGRMSLSYRKSNITAIVSGVEPDKFQEVIGGMLQLEQGRFLKAGDSRVVVFANDAAYQNFKEDIGLDRRVIINGMDFKVVGILAKSGSSIQGSDSDIFIPLQDARDALGASVGKREVNAIYGKIMEGADSVLVAERIEWKLMARHKVTEEDKDFMLITPEFINEQVGSIMGLLTAFLGGVAAISLIVGGVGVANTMFMSVMERTREIGILKAVGARSSIIMEVFLMESGIIGLVGGVIGVILGGLISVGATAAGLPSMVTIELAAFAIIFSVSIGMISGYFPARKASKLVTVEALRYE